MRDRVRRGLRWPSRLVLWFLCGAWTASLVAQEPSKQDLERAHSILAQVKEDLEQHYYDSTFGGLDLDARYRVADSAIDQASNMVHMMAIVAQFVGELNDSHTRLYPPGLTHSVQYGWSWQMIGESCYVTWVRKGSDAETKGLQRGDRLVAWDGMALTRQSVGPISYVYYALSPRQAVKLAVEKPDGTVQELVIEAKLTRRQQVIDYTQIETQASILAAYEQAARTNIHDWRSFGDTVMVWRMPSFRYADTYLGEMFRRARRHSALILDLRGNGGGSVVTVQEVLANLFAHEVTVGTTIRRGGKRAWVAKPAGNAFLGRLVILIDSESASASEIVARVAQLEYRATVLGDRSAGAVVESMFYGHRVGFTKGMDYTLQVSVSDFLSSDGKRLEGVGVVPDEVILPTPEDLVEERDPVMARALELVGITSDSKEAAKIFAT